MSIILEDEENPSSPSPRPFTAEQQKSFDKAVTKAFVYAGVPFNVLEQKELSEAVKIANPSAKLPTRQKAASTILHETFEEEKLEVFTKIRQDTYYYTIQADAAKGNDGFPYLHHCLSSPVNGFLIDFMNCRSISKNADFYAAQFTRVYELLPADIKMKVQAYVTDNCSTNQAAWAKIKAQHPHLIIVGCACHAFHLLTQDISIEASQRSRPFSYKGQRLENTFNLVSEFVTIFKTERFSFDINAELKQNKLRALVKPVLTRWAYCYYCVLFFYNAREILAKYARRLTEGVTGRSQRTYRQQLQAHFDNGERFTQLIRATERKDREKYLKKYRMWWRKKNVKKSRI